MEIDQLTVHDQKYLETFSSLERFSMNKTSLKSLENFPKSENLFKLELCANKLDGNQLRHLTIYAKTLHTLKLA